MRLRKSGEFDQGPIAYKWAWTQAPDLSAWTIKRNLKRRNVDRLTRSWQLEKRSRNKYPLHWNVHHKGKGGYAAITGPNWISGVPLLLDQSRLKVAVTKEKRKYNLFSSLLCTYLKCIHLILKFPQIRKFLFYFWHCLTLLRPGAHSCVLKIYGNQCLNTCLCFLFMKYSRHVPIVN